MWAAFEILSLKLYHPFMNPSDIPKVIKILRKEAARFRTPYVTEVSERKDPFKVLISCLISS